MVKIRWTRPGSVEVRRTPIKVYALILLFVACGLLLLPFVGHIVRLEPRASGVSDIGHHRSAFASHTMPKGELVWVDQTVRTVNGSPAAHGNSVFLSTGDSADTGSLLALDLLSGKETWNYKLNSFGGHSPVVYGEFVAVGDRSGTLHIVRNTDGRLIWTFEAGAPITGSPIIFDGLIYVIVTKGVHCLDAMTGESKWFSKTGDSFSGPANLSKSHGIISVIGNHENDGSDLQMYLIDAKSGKRRLTYPITSFLPSTPVISGSTVVMTRQHPREPDTLIAINLLSRYNPYLGAIHSLVRQAFVLGLANTFPMPQGYKWHRQIDGDPTNSVLSDEKQVYFIGKFLPSRRPEVISQTTFVGTLTAINPSNGSINWELSDKEVSEGIATLEQHGILIADQEGSLTYVDKATGNLRWSFDTDIRIGDRGIGHNSNIIVTSENGQVRVFR